MLVAGFVWLLGVTPESSWRDVSVDTKEKKVCVGFKRAAWLFFCLEESLSSCGSLLVR